MKRWACVPSLLIALGCAPAAAGGVPAAARVTKVSDGDTITVESSRVRHRCRLLGIDAPVLSYARLWTEMDKVTKYAPPEAQRELREARKAFRRWAEVMEAHAREARRVLAEMLADKNVRLAYDSRQPRRDRYGRLLVYVSVGDLDANAEMLRRGLAVADTRFRCDRLDEYVEHQRAAQASRVGIWAELDGSADRHENPGPGIEEGLSPTTPMSQPRKEGDSDHRRSRLDADL